MEQTPTLLIEVNVTAVADGTVSQSHRLEWAPTATSVVGEVLSLPLGGIDTLKNVISTRLLGTEASETTHMLQPPAAMAWHLVGACEVDLRVAELVPGAPSAPVNVTNRAAAPLFFTLLTSTHEGRFGHNLFAVPPRSSRVVQFLFNANGTAPLPVSAAEFERSLHADWLNREL